MDEIDIKILKLIQDGIQIIPEPFGLIAEELKGMLRVEHKGGLLDVAAGQAVIAHAGEWIRYSTPHEDGAEYIAVCLPAFSMETVHRDEKY